LTSISPNNNDLLYVSVSYLVEHVLLSFSLSCLSEWIMVKLIE